MYGPPSTPGYPPMPPPAPATYPSSSYPPQPGFYPPSGPSTHQYPQHGQSPQQQQQPSMYTPSMSGWSGPPSAPSSGQQQGNQSRRKRGGRGRDRRTKPPRQDEQHQSQSGGGPSGPTDAFGRSLRDEDRRSSSPPARSSANAAGPPPGKSYRGARDRSPKRTRTEPVMRTPQEQAEERARIHARVTAERICRTLFVRNVTYSANVEELKRQFERFGDIKTFFEIIGHRGMAFVTYYDVRAASAAKQGMQGYLAVNRPIDVHYSLPRPDEAAGRCGPDKGQGSARVLVENLRAPLPEHTLAQRLSTFGQVSTIFRPLSAPLNVRVVEFYDMRATEDAINQLQGTPFLDGTLHLEWEWDATPDTQFAPPVAQPAPPPSIAAAPYGLPPATPTHRDYPPARDPGRSAPSAPASNYYADSFRPPHQSGPPPMGYQGYGPPPPNRGDPRDSRGAYDSYYNAYPAAAPAARYDEGRQYRPPQSSADPYARDRSPYPSAPPSSTPVALDPSSQQLQSLLSTINATRSAPAVMPPRADAHGSQSPPFANEGRSGAGYNQPPRAMSPPQQDNMSQKLPPAVLSLLEGTGGSAASQAPPLPAPPPVPQPPPLTSGSDVSSLLALLAQHNDRK